MGGMMRPQSIIRFEWLYWAAFAIGMFSTYQTWAIQQNLLASNSAVEGMPWLPYASVVGRIALTIALWFFVARRPSAIAKWIIVVLAVYGAVLLALLCMSMLRGSAPLDLVLPSVAQNLLYIAAAALLFMPDARAWFGEGPAAAETAA